MRPYPEPESCARPWLLPAMSSRLEIVEKTAGTPSASAGSMDPSANAMGWVYAAPKTRRGRSVAVNRTAVARVQRPRAIMAARPGVSGARDGEAQRAHAAPGELHLQYGLREGRGRG